MKLLLARTHFSLGESIIKPQELPEAAKKMGYQAVGVVDTMNINAFIPLTLNASKIDMNVVCGCRIRVVDDAGLREKLKPDESGEHYWDVFIKNDDGFREVCELLTKGYDKDHFYYVPRVNFHELCELVSKGNVIVTTSNSNPVFINDNWTRYVEQIVDAGSAANVMIQIAPVATPLYDLLNRRAMEAASTHSLKVFASYPAYYPTEDKADIRDKYEVVVKNSRMGAVWNNIPYQRDSALLSRPELVKRAKAFVERTGIKIGADALDASHQYLIDQCEYSWHKMDICLPKMADDEMAELIKLCREGLKERVANPTFDNPITKEKMPVYAERLAYELKVLRDLGFAGYFLLVRDLVIKSKERSISVGPGRGSVGGSLVAYLIGITEVDPMRFGLIFERFINPERLDLPDADLDFMSSRRGEVISYLRETYGEDRVAGISNYTVLGSASALRDMARISELPPSEIAASKSISNYGDSVTLEEAAANIPEIENFMINHKEIFDCACELQGNMRNYGRHAAGVIVAGEPINRRAVVDAHGDEITINWDKRHCEDMGLIKLDVLGLSTLDLISIAVDMIKRNTGKDINIMGVSLEDERVIERFAKGDTIGIFQFESSGMMDLLKGLGRGSEPMTFETIAAATALYRPGPMESGMMEKFVAVAKGFSDPEMLHPKLADVTKETHGVLVYQEQVMEASRVLAGFTMAEADGLRKAMGKKDHELIMKVRDRFVEGCKEHSGIDEAEAGHIFDKIEAFAGYGFNKSHSVAYSLLSYQSMWLKTYYPKEFFAAALSILDEDKRPEIVKNAREYGIEIAPPDINESSDRFEVSYDKLRDQTILRAPFSSVKGCSEVGAKAIMKAREKVGGKFTDFGQFELAVEARRCNARVRDALNRVGAFASIIPGQQDSRHPDRRKDQMELLPGLIVDAAKSDREFKVDSFAQAKIINLMNEINEKSGMMNVSPRLGRSAKFMLLFDSPSNSDEQQGRIFDGRSHDELKEILKELGFNASHVYATALCKVAKPEDGFSNEHINFYTPYLMREIELVKPTIIVTLGSLATKALSSGKKRPSDLIGTMSYDSAKDAMIFYGFNPGTLYFRPEKRPELKAVFEKVKDAM